MQRRRRRRRPETEELVDLVLDWWGTTPHFCGCRLRKRVPRPGFTKQAAGRLVLHSDRHFEEAVALSKRNAEKVGLSCVRRVAPIG